MEIAKYVICGKEKKDNLTRYGALYFVKHKTEAWKLKHKINKINGNNVYIRPAKDLKFMNQFAA